MVKLNVYQKQHKRRYATKIHLTKEHWAKLNSSKLRDEDLKEVKKKMNALHSAAEKVIENLHPFSFVAFEEAFINGAANTPVNTNSRLLTDWFTITINLLNANDQVGTAASYQTTINSINNFKKKFANI